MTQRKTLPNAISATAATLDVPSGCAVLVNTDRSSSPGVACATAAPAECTSTLLISSRTLSRNPSVLKSDLQHNDRQLVDNHIEGKSCRRQSPAKRDDCAALSSVNIVINLSTLTGTRNSSSRIDSTTPSTSSADNLKKTVEHGRASKHFVQHSYADHAFRPYAFFVFPRATQESCTTGGGRRDHIVHPTQSSSPMLEQSGRQLGCGFSNKSTAAEDGRQKGMIKKMRDFEKEDTRACWNAQSRRHASTLMPPPLGLRTTSGCELSSVITEQRIFAGVDSGQHEPVKSSLVAFSCWNSASFPEKLHFILQATSNDVRLRHVFSWQPHGRCFLVHMPEEFAKLVLIRYFRHGKMTSFQRQLNMYNFKRITHGLDRGSYYHELFLRGRPLLCRYITRIRVKGTQVKAAPNPAAEPDFYSMTPCFETDATSDQQHTFSSVAVPQGEGHFMAVRFPPSNATQLSSSSPERRRSRLKFLDESEVELKLTNEELTTTVEKAPSAEGILPRLHVSKCENEFLQLQADVNHEDLLLLLPVRSQRPRGSMHLHNNDDRSSQEKQEGKEKHQHVVGKNRQEQQHNAIIHPSRTRTNIATTVGLLHPHEEGANKCQDSFHQKNKHGGYDFEGSLKTCSGSLIQTISCLPSAATRSAGGVAEKHNVLEKTSIVTSRSDICLTDPPRNKRPCLSQQSCWSHAADTASSEIVSSKYDYQHQQCDVLEAKHMMSSTQGLNPLFSLSLSLCIDNQREKTICEPAAEHDKITLSCESRTGAGSWKESEPEANDPLCDEDIDAVDPILLQVFENWLGSS